MPDDPTARLILDALARSTWPRSTAALTAATGLPQRRVLRTLEQLNDQGTVQRTGRGVYKLPDAGD